MLTAKGKGEERERKKERSKLSNKKGSSKASAQSSLSARGALLLRPSKVKVTLLNMPLRASEQKLVKSLQPKSHLKNVRVSHVKCSVKCGARLEGM